MNILKLLFLLMLFSQCNLQIAGYNISVKKQIDTGWRHYESKTPFNGISEIDTVQVHYKTKIPFTGIPSIEFPQAHGVAQPRPNIIHIDSIYTKKNK